jgi:hypothetical protein
VFGDERKEQGHGRRRSITRSFPFASALSRYRYPHPVRNQRPTPHPNAYSHSVAQSAIHSQRRHQQHQCSVEPPQSSNRYHQDSMSCPPCQKRRRKIPPAHATRAPCRCPISPIQRHPINAAVSQRAPVTLPRSLQSTHVPAPAPPA